MFDVVSSRWLRNAVHKGACIESTIGLPGSKKLLLADWETIEGKLLRHRGARWGKRR